MFLFVNGYPASKRLLAEIEIVASKVWSTAKSFQSFSCRFSTMAARKSIKCHPQGKKIRCWVESDGRWLHKNAARHLNRSNHEALTGNILDY